MDKIIVLVLLFIGFGLYLPGLNWGLMYKDRLNLIFKEKKEIDGLAQRMEGWRREVYKNRPHFMEEVVPSLDRDGTIIDLSDKILTDSEVTAIRSYFVHTYHPDESQGFAALSRINPLKGEFNPHAFTYGGGYLYPLGFSLLLSSLLRFTVLKRDLTYYFFNPEKLESLYIVGRLLSIVSVIAGAILLYILGKRLFGKKVGFLASIFLLISPLVFFQGHLMKCHTICMLYSIFTLYASVKILLEGKKIWYILQGIGIGLTVGAGVSTAPIFFWPIFAHILSYKRRPLFWLGGAIITGVLVFFLLNPFYILSFSEVKRELYGISKEYLGESSLISISLFFKLILSLKEPYNLGFPLWLLSILGIVYAIVKHSRIDILFLLSLLFTISPFLFRSYTTTPRFFLYILPLFFLLGARAILSLRLKLTRSILVFLILGYTGFYSFTYIYGFIMDGSSRSTRLIAGRWINENIPCGSTIGIESLPHITNLPPFRFFNYRLRITKNLSEKDFLPPYFLVVKPVSDLYYKKICENYRPLKDIKGLPFKYPHFALNREIEILIKK